MEDLKLMDMEKFKINRNFRLFFCGYQFFVFKCCLFGVSSSHLEFAYWGTAVMLSFVHISGSASILRPLVGRRL